MSNHSNFEKVIWPRDARVRVRSGARPAARPDAVAAAREKADRINANRELELTARMEHIMAGQPWIDRGELLGGLADYHKEALRRVPSSSRFPEAKPWVDYTLTYERELRARAGLNDSEIAVLMSLEPYLMFRGYRMLGLRRQEHSRRGAGKPPDNCRAAYLPDTDQGAVLIKNSEGDLVIWQAAPALPATAGRERYWWEHVDWAIEHAACGMHIDEEPPEIFPLPVFPMAAEHAADTPGVIEFLQRYSAFWGAQNILVVDRQLRAAAIEKSSYNYFEVFKPDANGRCYVSGMGCRDYSTPQGKHVADRRNEYCRLYGLPDDVIDRIFWKLCDGLETRLARAMATMPKAVKVQEVYDLFATPYPGGLAMDGYQFHPDQPFTFNTVVTYSTQLEQRRFCRWQRSADGKSWPRQPEICKFG